MLTVPSLLAVWIFIAAPQEALHVAAARGDAARVALLVRSGRKADVASVKRGGRTPLHSAAEAGFLDVVEVLLAAGVRPAPVTVEGWTPMHLAAAGGQVEVVRRLIAAESPIEAVDGLGDRPLHLAAENRWNEVVAALLEAGAEPDARDRFGRTALHRAAAFGYGECVQVLLAGGAQVDARSASGASALHVAVANGDEALYRALIAAGADAACKDGFGREPAELLERARVPVHELVEVERTPLDPSAEDPPLFHVWTSAGYPGPAGFEPGGLELAAWSDGAVLFAAEVDAPGLELRVGRLTPTALAILQRELDESGLPAIGVAAVCGPDSSVVQVTDLRGDEPRCITVDPANLHRLTERGGSTAGRRALRAWLRARTALRRALPSTSIAVDELVNDGVFRGRRTGIDFRGSSASDER